MNNRKELISVIVPAYNLEKYIKHCIDSIINQTHTELEVILINDGSTDNTGKICNIYAQKDKRIKVIHHNKRGRIGASRSRAEGITQSHAKLVCFVDGDDYIAKTCIEELYRAILETSSDIATCTNFIKYNDKILVDRPHTANNYNISDGLSNVKDFLSNRTFTRPTMWGKLYKTALLSQIDFPSEDMYEDNFINLEAYYRAKRSVFVDKPLYYYRRDNINGLTQTKNEAHVRRMIDFFSAIRMLQRKEKIDIENEATSFINRESARLLSLLYNYSVHNDKAYFSKLKKFFEDHKNRKYLTLAQNTYVRLSAIGLTPVRVLFLLKRGVSKTLMKLSTYCRQNTSIFYKR